VKKNCCSILCFLFSYNLCDAQFIKGELQAAGLTCSLCSKSTVGQLKTLDFIDSIGTDLAHASFTLYFKKDKPIDLSQIKKKVEDAGFSVASLSLTAKFDNLKVDSSGCFNYQNIGFCIVTRNPHTLNGDVNFKIIDKGFVTGKEYKKYGRKVGIITTYSGTHIYDITL
jgi:copper chaperone CopZ